MKISEVIKPLKTPYSLYVIDDQSYYAEDLKKIYSEKKKYSIFVFSSLYRFTEFLSQHLTLKKAIKIAVISIRTSSGGDNSPIMIVEKLLASFPSLSIVKIADEKELPKDESYKRSGRIIMVKRNENTLLRVDNSIKFIIGQRTLENTIKERRIADRLFIVSLILFILSALFVRIVFPKIFYF